MAHCITIKIETDNAAFDGADRRYEVARILRKVAYDIDRGDTPDALHDINGNRVGTFKGKLD